MPDLPPLAKYTVDEIPPPAKPRRIVFFSKRKQHTRVTMHFIRGFEANGHEVLWLRWSRIRNRVGRWLGKMLVRRRMRQFRPDMVLIYKKDADLDVVASLPADVPRVMFYEDLFFEAEPEVIDMARAVSLFLTTARGDVVDFKKVGVPHADYIRTGCDPTDHFIDQAQPDVAGDVAFIGAPNMPNRTELLSAVAGEFDLSLYGRGWQNAIGRPAVREDVFPDDLRRICASTKIIIGIDKRHDIDAYFSNRTWLTLGCGGFLLTRYVEGLEEYFNNHEHLVWFNSIDECLELIRDYLPKEDERRRIAQAGRDYVHTYHTFRHATAEMVAKAFGEPW
jgi:glycosyl transferase family 1